MKKGIKKALMIIGIILLVLVIGFVALMIATTHSSKDSSSNNTSTEPTSSDYYDVGDSDEAQPLNGEKTSTEISLNQDEYQEFMEVANNQDIGFTYGDYFHIEDALQKDYVINSEPTYDLTALDENGKVDAKKLYAIAQSHKDIKPNKVAYEEVSDEKAMEICELIANTINDNMDKCDSKRIATFLSKLRIYEDTTSTSFAYVNSYGQIAFNSTMMNLTAPMNSMQTDETAVFTHEVMHILQYSSSFDGDNTDIGNIGFSRYDFTNKDDIQPLYLEWVEEASADVSAQEYLGYENSQLSYSQYITYLNSISMGYMFNDGFNRTMVPNIGYCANVYDVFDKLGIEDEAQQIEFLKLLSAIEISQSQKGSFFDNYPKEAGIAEFTDEMKNDISYTCISEAQRYLVNSFYKDLAKYVLENDVDLETVFFLARFCELDASTHMKYPKISTYDHYIKNVQSHYELQQALFEAIANSSDMSIDEVNSLYDNYKMYLADSKNSDNMIPNCNWDSFTKEQQEYIEYANSLHSYFKFARLKTMMNFEPNK